MGVAACLPRGLDSCRYGGAAGVTLSELGPESSGDRSSKPSEAMSLCAHRGTSVSCAGSALGREVRPGGGGWWAGGAQEQRPALVVGAESLRSDSPSDGSLVEGGAPRCPPPPYSPPPSQECPPDATVGVVMCNRSVFQTNIGVS